jgi:hypothetical protein
MCGACQPRDRDPRLSGPRDWVAAADAVEELTGLRTRVASGQWTVSTATGRQLVCPTIEELADAAASLSGTSAPQVLAGILAALPQARQSA